MLSANPCGTHPCIDPAFGLTQSYFYWSATAVTPGAGGSAWDVNFSDGAVSALTKTTPVEGADYVRAVRGGL